MAKRKRKPNTVLAWACSHTDQLHKARGLCKSCYCKWQQTDSPNINICLSCGKTKYILLTSNGLCELCFRRKTNTGICDSCGKERKYKVIGEKLCDTCYHKIKSPRATCHPDKPKGSKDGLCDSCAQVKRKRHKASLKPKSTKIIRVPDKCVHITSKHGGRGLCVRCFTRDDKLRRSYGITLDEFTKLLEFSNYQCGICNKHVPNGVDIPGNEGNKAVGSRPRNR